MHILYHHQQICLVIAWACLIDYNGGVRGLHSRNSFFLGVNIAAWVFVIVWFIGYLFMICNQIKLSNQMLIVSHFLKTRGQFTFDCASTKESHTIQNISDTVFYEQIVYSM